MPWGRLDDSLYDHPKLDLLTEDRLAGVGLWAVAISWCNRHLTDGHVPVRQIDRLGGTRELADALVEVGLFDRDDDGGYLVHDFLQFNDSKADVLARRQREAHRKAEYRRAKGSTTGMSQRDTDDVPAGQMSESRTMSQRDSEMSQRDMSRKVSRRDTRAHPHASAGAAPDANPDPNPTRPDPTDSSPQPPASGGYGRRANGTSPRQLAKAVIDAQAEAAEGRRHRRNQRHLAYLRGAISADQQADMDRRDAPLEELPDWAEHVERGRAEQESEGALAEAWVPR